MKIEEIRESLETCSSRLSRYEGGLCRARDGRAHGLCLYIRQLRGLADKLDDIYQGKDLESD